MAIRDAPEWEHACGGDVEHHTGGMSPGGSGWLVCKQCGARNYMMSDEFAWRGVPSYETWRTRLRRVRAQS